jgi:hypothetical protein
VNPISFVIAGPFSSRFPRIPGVEELFEGLSFLRQLHPENEIILSTYKGEISGSHFSLFDTVIESDDPGPDYIRTGPWPITKDEYSGANFSRMFQTSCLGIGKASNDIVIKSRIELYPLDFVRFQRWLNLYNCELAQGVPRIGFFLEHYSGISFSVDGLLGGLPDTLQIGRRDTMMTLWSESQRFWLENRNVLGRSSLRFPLTSEQILGITFLSLYCNFNPRERIARLRRYFISQDLIQSVLKAERDFYVWSEYKSSGFSANYLKGSSFIHTPLVSFRTPRSQIPLRLLFILAKRVKHHYRRYLVALRKEFGLLVLKFSGE